MLVNNFAEAHENLQLSQLVVLSFLHFIVFKRKWSQKKEHSEQLRTIEFSVDVDDRF